MSTMYQDEFRSHGKNIARVRRSTLLTPNTTMITPKGHPKGIFISDKQGAKNSQQSMDPTT